MAKLGLVVGMETLEAALAARLRGEALSTATRDRPRGAAGEWV